MNMTIAEFCDRHWACAKGREWAIAHCTDMADAWAKLQSQWFLWVAARPGVLTDQELRLGAVASARLVEHLMTDQRSRDALNVAERHANGLATDAELAAASAAACAARAAACAARATARAATWAAADAADAAYAAYAASAAYAAGSAAAWAATDAASAAARAAASAAAYAASAAYAAGSAAYAAGSAAYAAGSAAARDETQAKIVQWYRENTRPNFEVQ